MLALVPGYAASHVAPVMARASATRTLARMSEPVPVEADPAPGVAPPTPAPTAVGKNSAAIPFLSRPEKLDGSMIGDVGFDPFGLSTIDGEYINLNWMREAELKHGRIAMLATAGWIAVDLGIKFPVEKFTGLTSLNAHDPMVLSGDLAYLLLIVGGFETVMGVQLFEKGHVPGDYGWDPLNLGKGDPEAAIKELKNGRLAMLAFSGIVTQSALTGKGFPYF
mmetsp:Transcript_16768/g.45168  ORF Transcript_16768/g.45168 Transcript_16768/m.45168 type:complete len:222 (-) Transcript_16768:332-997(-)